MMEKNNNSGSGDKFSFPIFPLVEEEDHHVVGSGYGFEFSGYATDHSGRSPSPIDSPADHLFFNGRLLPHAFPSQVPPMTNNTFYSLSRSTSVTSSKDYSFVSSRSNSRSSSCSSARTSVSTTDSASSSIASYERKLFVTHHRHRHRPKVLSGSTSRRSVSTSSSSHYGSSRRWQFIITPPVPTPPALILKKKKKKKNKEEEEGKCGSRARKANKTWFWRRFFRSFVSACKECHAIN